MKFYYVGTTLFVLLIALIIIDPNVGMYIDLQYKLFVINLKRFKLLITLYPILMYSQWKINQDLKKHQGNNYGSDN
jgi:hypothetical protein